MDWLFAVSAGLLLGGIVETYLVDAIRAGRLRPGIVPTLLGLLGLAADFLS